VCSASSRSRRTRPKPDIRSHAGIRNWLAAAALAAVGLACGCTKFDNPIVAESGPALDAGLIGLWSCTDEGRGSMSLDIARDGDAGRVIIVSTGKGEEPQTDQGRLITARLERNTYASVRGGEDGKDGWTLLRYELRDPGRLTIYLDNGKFWTDAVRDRIVSGNIGMTEAKDGNLSVSATTVTASSDEMRKVVLGYGGVIFDDNPVPCEFVRSTAMTRSFAALICLPLAACVQSPVPLESGARVTDPVLAGTWKSDLQGDPLVATFRQDKDGKLVADVQGYFEPGPRASTQHYEIVLARFGEQRYMSIRDPKISPDYSLARYVVVSKDRFCVFATFSDALANDVEQTVVAGQIKSDRHASSVVLSADAGQLREYFSKHGASAFQEHDEAALVFQRVSSATLPPPKEPPDDPDSIVATRCRP